MQMRHKAVCLRRCICTLGGMRKNSRKCVEQVQFPPNKHTKKKLQKMDRFPKFFCRSLSYRLNRRLMQKFKQKSQILNWLGHQKLKGQKIQAFTKNIKRIRTRHNVYSMSEISMYIQSIQVSGNESQRWCVRVVVGSIQKAITESGQYGQ